MSSAQHGSLREKVTLVRCHDWTLAFEARYVRQVGFLDLLVDLEVERDSPFRSHVGSATVNGAPCSVWDLGLHLDGAACERAVVVLERPGGYVGFRCGEILSVESVPGDRRLQLPASVSARPGLFKSLLLLGGDDDRRSAHLLRTSALLAGNEVRQVHRDWTAITARA